MGYISYGDGAEAFVRNDEKGKLKLFQPRVFHESVAAGIMPDGTAAGWNHTRDETGRNVVWGFLRHPDRRIEYFSAEDAQYTRVNGMNANGMMVGQYSSDGGPTHAFVRARDGTVAGFDPPGSIYTEALAVSAKGIVTGDYIDAQHKYHGFVRSADGTLESVDVEGALNTLPRAVNAKGVVTGWWIDASFVHHGFVRTP